LAYETLRLVSTFPVSIFVSIFLVSIRLYVGPGSIRLSFAACF